MYCMWIDHISHKLGTGRSFGPHEGLETETEKPSGGEIQEGGRVCGSYIHILPGPNWNYN